MKSFSRFFLRFEYSMEHVFVFVLFDRLYCLFVFFFMYIFIYLYSFIYKHTIAWKDPGIQHKQAANKR